MLRDLTLDASRDDQARSSITVSTCSVPMAPSKVLRRPQPLEAVTSLHRFTRFGGESLEPLYLVLFEP